MRLVSSMVERHWSYFSQLILEGFFYSFSIRLKTFPRNYIPIFFSLEISSSVNEEWIQEMVIQHWSLYSTAHFQPLIGTYSYGSLLPTDCCDATSRG